MPFSAIVVLAIALTASILVIHAARGRRALHARFVSSAPGTVIVSIRNATPLPVRVDQIVRREGWIGGRDHDFSAWSAARDSSPLPVVVSPGYNVFVPLHNVETYASRGRWFLVDATGHRYAIRSGRWSVAKLLGR